VVDHDVEAEDLVAECVIHVVGLARPKQVMHVRLCEAHSLYNDLVNFIFDAIAGEHAKLGLDLIQDELIRALASNIVRILVRVLHKGTRLLIDGVVSEVHAEVVEI